MHEVLEDHAGRAPFPAVGEAAVVAGLPRHGEHVPVERLRVRELRVPGSDLGCVFGCSLAAALLGRANLAGLVLGCIEAKFCKRICV